MTLISNIRLQLETETKASLRPAMMSLGLDLREQAEYRKIAMEMASSMEGKSWEETMTIILDAVKPAEEQYKAIASVAPPKYLETCPVYGCA